MKDREIVEWVLAPGLVDLEGGFDLDNLNGFALVTETRRVVLTPGSMPLRPVIRESPPPLPASAIRRNAFAAAAW